MRNRTTPLRRRGRWLTQVDGVRGIGTSGGGVPADQVIIAAEYIGKPGAITAEKFTTRPAGEVIGWRVLCTCRDDTPGRGPSSWTSDLVVRVPSPALEDHQAGRIFTAQDEDVIDIDDLHPLVFQQLWHHQHVDAREALSQIFNAQQRERDARHGLDTAVSAARQLGHSWEAIGRAVGMTRQSAHERWRHL